MIRRPIHFCLRTVIPEHICFLQNQWQNMINAIVISIIEIVLAIPSPFGYCESWYHSRSESTKCNYDFAKRRFIRFHHNWPQHGFCESAMHILSAADKRNELFFWFRHAKPLMVFNYELLKFVDNFCVRNRWLSQQIRCGGSGYTSIYMYFFVASTFF